jgi:hypothetical protein
MVRLLHAARLDRPLRPIGAVKTADAQWRGLSLQSLLNMSLGCTPSTRGGEVLRCEAENLL